MVRVVILGSGRGSNAAAILEAEAAGRLGGAEVVGLVSDRADAGILALGPRFGVSALYLEPGKFRTKLTPEAEAHYIEVIQQFAPHLVVLAGFMRVIKTPFIDAFEGRVLNLHPSLLPDFPGLHAIRQAYEAGVAETGCSVHWVNDVVDGGEIIAQARVPRHESDTLEQLEARVHEAEHELLPRVVRTLAQQLFESSAV